MPDSPDKSLSPQSAKPSKEMSMEVRLLIAFLLMGGILFLTPYIYKPPAPAKPAAAPVASGNASAEKPAAAVAPVSPPLPAAPPAGQVAGAAEEAYVVDTSLYHIVFSNRGAVVKSWTLKKYKDSAGKPLELIDTPAGGGTPEPFSLLFPANHAPSTDPNSALFAAKAAGDGIGVDFEFFDGKVSCRKSFRFERASYLSKVTTEATQNGTPLSHMIEWRGGFGDATVLNAPAAQHALYYDLADNKLRVKTGKDGKNGPVIAKGTYSFAGLEDAFFAAVFLPADNTTVELDTYGDNLPRGPDKKLDPHVGVAVGGDSVNRFTLFAGPKDVDLLNRVDPRLKQLIDWGWFGVIAKPLFLVMKAVDSRWIHNWGWSIILLTIALNLLLLPLRFTSMRSAKKMQALQPQIATINAKYKNVKMNDPRNAEKNAEVMDLYKKHGVNPVGGCLPMVLQLPLVYAFYKVLTVTIELRNAPWLWVTDLSQPEHLAIRILPTVMIVTQFLVQKLTPNPSVDPSQAKMMMFMPLVLGFFFYYQSSGLVLYWLTGNLVGIFTQWLMNRGASPVAIATPKAIQKKKTSKA